MITEYTIGQLAMAADIPAATVRYDERIGLVDTAAQRSSTESGTTSLTAPKAGQSR